MKLGILVFGLASIAAGVLDLIWGEFEAAHQPVGALSDHIPGIQILAYIGAACLIAGGAAILWRRTARIGAVALAVIYSVFALCQVPRLYTAPHALGFRIGLLAGVSAGIAQQLILVVAAVIVYASLPARGTLSRAAALILRWVFGLSTVDFGIAHLTGVQAVAPMIPKWMPLGGDFWTVLTGIAFVLAGIAIAGGVLDVLAARLLALMLLVFSVLVLAPRVAASPGNHVTWGGNAYNLATVGAAWIVAEWLGSEPRP